MDEEKEIKDKDSYEQFVGKKCKIILDVNSKTLVYIGLIKNIDEENIFVQDHRRGYALLRKNDISQIIILPELNGGQE